MFYDAKHVAYSIKGVYHIKREPQNKMLKNRKHTALSIRLSGHSRFCFDCESFTAEKNSIVYIPAGVDYTICGTEEELIVVHLDCFCEETHRIEVVEGSALKEAFSEMFRLWDSGASYALCMAALYGIFEEIRKKEQESQEVPELIRDGVYRLEQEYKNPGLTVELLAEHCHISTVYFRKLFKAHFGMSPHAAILEKRFSYAENLLSSGHFSVKKIADSAGFSDVKYFRTAFKKRYGMTASEYMKRAE